MGFLSLGDTLNWEEALSFIEYIREHGVTQFLNIYKKNHSRDGDIMLWGDEVEYISIKVKDQDRLVTLNLRANDVLDELIKIEEATPPKQRTVSFKPEYGRYMIEATPGNPYSDDINSIAQVENNMRERRKIVRSHLQPDEYIITLTHFPLMGVNSPDVKGPIANSLFISDSVINKHKRFGTLTQNIRIRKGSNISINVPLFMDKFTKPLTYEEFFPGVPPSEIPAKTNHVYADAMAFGMGQCCLQTTFSLPNIHVARQVYDQLLPLTPILLSLTAATPILRGYLTDTDVRWDIISAAVDDRTPEELGLEPLKKSKYVIDKSRYGSLSSYLNNDDPLLNDVPLIIDPSIYNRLREQGIDHLLAQHIAHLFIRDPLVIYNDRIEIDDNNETDHFENFQSTNWQTLRFKPPPAHSSIGWRVEFRSSEASITDFENAAFAALTYLFTRVIMHYNLNTYMPLSKVDENMDKAHKRGSVIHDKFWFRKDISHSSGPEVGLFTIDEILNGSSKFIGFIPLIRKYVSTTKIDPSVNELLEKYLKLIQLRANGSLKSTATWIRDFVQSHKDYKFDSIVSQSITYDLCKTVELINTGTIKVPELVGNFHNIKSYL